MLLCFSSARYFTFITSSESWEWVALSARRWVAFWYWSCRLSKCAALKRISSASAAIWPLRALNRALAGSESSTSWAVSWWSRASKSSSFALISADEIPIAWEELASSPSSLEISMAKENRLSGESGSWKRKGARLEDDNQIAYLFQSYISPLASQGRWYHRLIGWSCRWDNVSWKINKNNYKMKRWVHRQWFHR